MPTKPIPMTPESRAKETFREWCFRCGVWPPISGTRIDETFRRLGDAFVEYVDQVVAPPAQPPSKKD